MMCQQHLTLFNMRAHKAKIEKALQDNPHDLIAQIALREMNKRINRTASKIKTERLKGLAEARKPKPSTKAAGICEFKRCKFLAMPNSRTCLAHKDSRKTLPGGE